MGITPAGANDGNPNLATHLSAAAVYDAISYYLDHRAEIEQEIAAHRIESILAETGAQTDERGLVTIY